MKQVLFFTDADKDDLFVLTCLITQMHLGCINLIGIVCDDGFLNFPQNVHMIYFWLTKVLQLKCLPPLLRGSPRSAYLEQQRTFPENFISSYISTMEKVFGYEPCPPAPIPPLVPLDFFMTSVLQMNCHTLSVLITGPCTTFATLLHQYPSFSSIVHDMTNMGGNYAVPGNIVPANPNDPQIVANAEYNAWLNPDALTVISTHLHPFKWSIVPLDCTQYVPLDEKTIQTFETLGTPFYQECQDPFLRNAYTQLVLLLQTTLQTLNTKLYLWDETALVIFYGLPVNARYICQNIYISWTGQLLAGLHCLSPFRIYNYIDYSLVLQNLIYSIFQPLCHFQYKTFSE